MIELELMVIERAFPEAQRLLAGIPNQTVGRYRTGWHDTSVSRHTGAAAVVRRDGPLAEEVGETLYLISDYGAAYVYVVGGADLLTDISVARRAFLALGQLAEEELDVRVERL